jgi:hypothetical protein
VTRLRLLLVTITVLFGIYAAVSWVAGELRDAGVSTVVAMLALLTFGFIDFLEERGRAVAERLGLGRCESCGDLETVEVLAITGGLCARCRCRVSA